MAHLYRVIVPVSDIDKAEAFYSDLLEQPGRRVSPERHYFDCEGVILACFDPAKYDEHPWTANPEHIYLAVDDLAAMLETAKRAGAKVVADIDSYPWGETSFYCDDPFGNQLCFVDRATVFTG